MKILRNFMIRLAYLNTKPWKLSEDGIFKQEKYYNTFLFSKKKPLTTRAFFFDTKIKTSYFDEYLFLIQVAQHKIEGDQPQQRVQMRSQLCV
jgi:hypothetical protein